VWGESRPVHIATLEWRRAAERMEAQPAGPAATPFGVGIDYSPRSGGRAARTPGYHLRPLSRSTVPGRDAIATARNLNWDALGCAGHPVDHLAGKTYSW
jgi:hypothetical protein